MSNKKFCSEFIKLREKFDIHVVEDHNDALEYIYKKIGCKQLSFNNLVMIHFDSHPDLGIPSDLNAESILNKETLLENLSIENWILPAVFAGHISVIIWIRPSWSTQIDLGKFDLIIGKTDKGNVLCNSKESYFLSDSLYTNEANLSEKREFTLYVCDFDSIINQNDTFLLDTLNSINQEDKKIILDIDLDFFSTIDPFKQMFRNIEDYDLFKSIYETLLIDLKTDDENFDIKYENFLIEKQKKLKAIWNVYSNLSESKSNENALNDSNLFNKVKKMAKIIESNNLDAEILHIYGSGIDDTPLPHNISSINELKVLMNKMKIFFQIYFGKSSHESYLKPSILTIARSSLDDYCPVNQVDFIQDEILEIIKTFFNIKYINSIHLNY